MRTIFKFILFSILFNMAAFFIASTGWFPSTLYGNAVTRISLDDPATLSSSEDIFMRMVENDIAANIISDNIGLSGEVTFIAIIVGLLVGSIAIGWLSKGSGTTIVGMAVIAYLFYAMFMNSKTFFDKIISNFPMQVSYLTVMVGFGLLFMFIILFIDFASGQKSTS